MPSKLDAATLRHNLIRALNSTTLHLPESYLVLDLETTDTEPANAVIWQIGTYGVVDGQPQAGAQGEAIYLKHDEALLKKASFEISRRRANATMSVAGRDLDTRIRDGAYYKAEQGFIDDVNTKGLPPKDAIQYLMDTVNVYVENGWPLVGQNFVKFDIPFLEYACKYYGVPCKFPRDKLIDTGMLIKAAILGRRMGYDETCRDFYVRVAEVRAKGVYFALERFCIPYWHMDTKYGINVHDAHNAGYDCMITALVLKELVDEVLNSEGVTNVGSGN